LPAAAQVLPAAAEVAGSPPETTATSPDAIKRREQNSDDRAQQKARGTAAKLRADIAAIVGPRQAQSTRSTSPGARRRDQIGGKVRMRRSIRASG
jgi:hypothetical protein